MGEVPGQFVGGILSFEKEGRFATNDLLLSVCQPKEGKYDVDAGSALYKKLEVNNDLAVINMPKRKSRMTSSWVCEGADKAKEEMRHATMQREVRDTRMTLRTPSSTQSPD